MGVGSKEIELVKEIEEKLDSGKVPVHIIGAGGTGMSGLAQVLFNYGIDVSASDKNGGVYLDKLKSLGVKTWTGSSPEQIPENSLVFFSTAVPETDPERQYCQNNNIPVFRRHYLLEYITKKYYTIAVCGTHGKTTTTGWIGLLFEEAGFDPNVLVGGTLKQWGSNTRLGDGKIDGMPLLIMEADESDGSFEFIKAREIYVTNIEMDHVDHYLSDSQLEEGFRAFIQKAVSDRGKVFFSSDFSKDKKIYRDYRQQADPADQQKIFVDDVKLTVYNGDQVVFSGGVSLSGAHNLFNASLVVQSALEHKIEPGTISKVLLDYQGVGRRMDLLFTGSSKQGYRYSLMDDYAHHPTEIDVVLDALVKQGESLVIVWEPHRVSRFLHFQKEFSVVFEKYASSIRKVFLMEIFDAGGEKNSGKFPGWESTWESWRSRTDGLVDLSEGSLKPLTEITGGLHEKTTILFLGAGNSSNAAHLLREVLEKNK